MRIFHDRHNDRHVDRSPISDDTKMGIVLVVVAMVAFAGYGGVMLIGFLMDMING